MFYTESCEMSHQHLLIVLIVILPTSDEIMKLPSNHAFILSTSRQTLAAGMSSA